jgi:ABC-type branched-subunit amino acid transport system ATPase component
MTLLKAENLCKLFGGLKAINGVSFEVRESEILALIGPNGAGKTTLLNLITNFVRPDKGHVIFCEKSIDGWPRHNIVRLGIARTFQTLTIFENLTAVDNITIGHSSRVSMRLSNVLDFFSYHKKKKENQESSLKVLNDVIEFVNLERKYINWPVNELSIIDKKKVAIACALASEPKLLLLDEPLAGLNQTEAQEVLDLMRKTKSAGTSILLIDHNLEAVMSVADRVLCLNFGEFVCEGLPSEVIADSKVREVYLGE